MTSATQNLLAVALAAPKTHVVQTAYADGVVKRHETRSLAAAENWAIGERRKIGRTLVDRVTGRNVQVVSVEVLEIDR